MNKLQAGGNVAIGNAESVDVRISWLPENAAIDICAFVLNANHKVRNDDDFIFYNQPETKNGFLRLLTDKNQLPFFHVEFAKIPPQIEKIIFAATTSGSLAALADLTIEVANFATFTPVPEDMQSLILAEIYLNKGQWKFKAVGQGFKQGLEALANHYGVSVDDVDNNVAAHVEPAASPSQESTQTSTSSVIKIGHDTNTQPPAANQNLIRTTDSSDIVEREADILPPAPNLSSMQITVKMIKDLSWMWVFSSFWVFVLLELFLGGFIGAMVVGRFVPHMLTYQIEVLLLLSSFFIGGAIVGLISPTVRVLEPALAGFFSVLLTFSVSFFSPYQFIVFSWTKVIIGGGIAFLLALFGARFGEKISARMGNKNSQEVFGDGK